MTMTDTQNVIAPETVAELQKRALKQAQWFDHLSNNYMVDTVKKDGSHTNPSAEAWRQAAILLREMSAALQRQPAQSPTYEEAIRALEDIALLDEADGHLLKCEHASRAVAIATSMLKKHPSQIHSERQQTAPGMAFGRPIAQSPPQVVWDAYHNRSYEPVEKRAAEIYATYRYNGPGEKPPWVPNGNSFVQDELRKQARQELRELGHTSVTQSPLSQGGGEDYLTKSPASELYGMKQIYPVKPAPGAEAVAQISAEIEPELDRLIDAALVDIGSVPAERLKQFLWDNKIGILHCLQSLRSPATPAPAQGVVVTTKMVERLAMFYERRRTHPPPRSIFDVPINTRQRIMDDARAALQAALHPTPTPAQGVTDEAVNRAMLAVQKGCDITPREMRRAIQAAFHPAEKE